MFTEYQLKQFDTVISHLEKQGVNIPIKHFACSSAGILYAQSRFNGVRLGLSLYGLYPDDSSRKKINLRPALSWCTKIIQIKTVPAWTKIGYGGTFTTKKITRLAIIPVGYYDGYDRRFSNTAAVVINGKKCPIRGRICMNLAIVDISGARAKAGDKVLLIGKSGKQSITVDDLAKVANTINYEIVDRINPLISRIVI
jgi:alanine racemase